MVSSVDSYIAVQDSKGENKVLRECRCQETCFRARESLVKEDSKCIYYSHLKSETILFVMSDFKILNLIFVNFHFIENIYIVS